MLYQHALTKSSLQLHCLLATLWCVYRNVNLLATICRMCVTCGWHLCMSLCCGDYIIVHIWEWSQCILLWAQGCPFTYRVWVLVCKCCTLIYFSKCSDKQQLKLLLNHQIYVCWCLCLINEVVYLLYYGYVWWSQCHFWGDPLVYISVVSCIYTN